MTLNCIKFAWLYKLEIRPCLACIRKMSEFTIKKTYQRIFTAEYMAKYVSSLVFRPKFWCQRNSEMKGKFHHCLGWIFLDWSNMCELIVFRNTVISLISLCNWSRRSWLIKIMLHLSMIIYKQRFLSMTLLSLQNSLPSHHVWSLEYCSENHSEQGLLRVGKMELSPE